MARISRRELKEDEFISEFEELLLFLEENREMILALVLAVVLGAGALGGFWWRAQRQEQQARLAVAQALDIYSAPIRPADAPANLPGPSFTSAKEKYEAAQKEFARIRTEFARTSMAVVAKHFEALALAELGQEDEAVRLLAEMSRAAQPERAALARLHLSNLYQKRGQTEQARKLYQQLADHPTLSVPRPLAVMALADLLAPTEPAEARKLYEELKRTIDDRQLTAQIDRRLELLPTTP